ncbi:hypothetical protein [Flavobacterium aciduliphilum]|nr:hypothetical protein [Flavobacterium aciduliphilum]
MFSNAATNKYLIKDLFDVRQGKLALLQDKVVPNDTNDALDNEKVQETKTIDVLTLNSINWELATIRKELLFKITEPKTIPQPLTANDFIINRVGQTKGCSLLESNFDFENHKVIPSHHFLVLTPRTIIQPNQLPFFHAVVDVFLTDLVKAQKNDQDKSESNIEKKQKSIYVTVKEIENIEIELPSENFDLLISQYNQYYTMYAASYKNFMASKNNLENHKLELSKFFKKEFDWNK